MQAPWHAALFNTTTAMGAVIFREAGAVHTNCPNCWESVSGAPLTFLQNLRTRIPAKSRRLVHSCILSYAPPTQLILQSAAGGIKRIFLELSSWHKSVQTNDSCAPFGVLRAPSIEPTVSHLRRHHRAAAQALLTLQGHSPGIFMLPQISAKNRFTTDKKCECPSVWAPYSHVWAEV